MLSIIKPMNILVLLLASILLIACSAQTAPSVGFWKADDNNYIEIVKDGSGYSAGVYQPSSFDSTFERTDYPATFSNGVLTIERPHGPLPVHYDAENDVTVLYGNEIYERVDEASTRSQLATRLKQIELDAADCARLQDQVNAKRGTFGDRTECQAFMDSMINQRPNKCRLSYTSCGSL